MLAAALVLAALLAQDPAAGAAPPQTPAQPPAQRAPLASGLDVQDPPVESWPFSAGSLDSFLDPDSLVLVFQNPVFRGPDSETRATWAVFWIDRHRLGELSPEDREAIRQPFGTAPGGDPSPLHASTFFSRLRAGPLADVAREFYMEGPIEYFRQGKRVARAGAFYLDLVEGHGWLADVSISLSERMGSREIAFFLHTDWMRHSADGSLHASSATLTTCDFAEPHVKIISGDLRLEPTEGDPRNPWKVTLKDNRIVFHDIIVLPLPRFSKGVGADYKPTWDGFKIGGGGRFGFSVGADLNLGLGGMGPKVNELFRGNPSDFDADSKVHLSYLGSRGVLVDTQARVSSPERYWWQLSLGLVPDQGEDEGLVPVDEDDRDTLRAFFRSRGRFTIDDRQWVDLVITSQSDPGVQAEFWEREFLRWEEREDYLHWRRARGEDLASATVQVRSNSFRSDVEELPSAQHYAGQREILALGSASLMWGSSASAAYLRRVEGEPGPTSPFDPPLLPAAEVLRADVSERLNLLLPVSASGLRLTPFAELRGTAWSEDQTEEDEPTRLAVLGGARLSSALWKSTSAGGLAYASPYVEYRQDLLLEEQGGQPETFDQVEAPLDGEFVEAGLYTRWSLAALRTDLDLDVRQPHAIDAPDGAESGWLPMAILANLSVDAGATSVGMSHDARYDFSPHETVYSNTSVGVGRPGEWGFEMSHHRGLDNLRDALFEAASAAGRWQWTPKWEFEGRQTFSLLGDESLATRAILRRFGHDLVLEIEFSVRSGEGGAGISVNLKPLIGWDSSDLGLLDPWSY